MVWTLLWEECLPLVIKHCMGLLRKKKVSLPYYQCCSRRAHKRKEYAFSKKIQILHTSVSLFPGLLESLKKKKKNQQIWKIPHIMFTGMEGVYQFVLVFHWSILQVLHLGLSKASELHHVRGNRWCIFGPLGQEHVSPFLNEKWMVEEIKLRGVEWGMVKAPDMNSLTCLSTAISGTQLTVGPVTTTVRETRAGGGGFTNRAPCFRNYN